MNLQAPFDLAYIREVHPRFNGLDDVSCCNALLDEPELAGPKTSRDHLLALGLDLASYPEAFPWKLYARIVPVAGAHRWAALEHFCNHGFASGIRVPFDEDGKSFLIVLARSYAGRCDRLAIQAFELAAIVGSLTSGERQHLADSYLREGLWQPARRIYESLIRQDHELGDEVTVWTTRNCVLASLALGDWDHAANILATSRATMGKDPVWRSATIDLLEQSFAAGLQAARARYCVDDTNHGDAIVELTVARACDFLKRLEAPPTFTRGSPEVILIANRDDPTSRRARVETKEALFTSLGTPWSLVPMGELTNVEALPSNVGAIVFFNVPASLGSLRVLLGARAAGIGTVYEADGPIFDQTCMPAPLASFDGFLAPPLHDELRVACALYRALAARCDVGMSAASLTAVKLAALVVRRVGFVLANGADVEPSPATVNHAAPVLFLRSPRFLNVTVESGSLGAALVDALRRDPSLRLVVSGHVRLVEAFNEHDTQIDELGAQAPEVRIEAALRSAILNIAPEPVLDDDGVADLSWLEAARYGVATAIDRRMAEVLGLTDGRTCVMIDKGGWALALTRCLRDPRGVATIGEHARVLARTTRTVAARASQLASTLAALTAPNDHGSST